MSHKNNSAKFAFLYILSLIALIFVALSVGMIVFQVINKEIVDLINEYSGRYSDDAMRFAISSIIIATPIFYISSRQIYKNLYSGKLDQESAVRKWLTYLILLVAIVVMIGWLIGTINSFLGGELSSKAILKSLAALFISGGIFSFYFYDIRREKIKHYKDRVIKISFLISLAVVGIVFVVALFIVDSPSEVRKKKMDDRITSSFYQIDNSLNDYYNEEKRLPATLEELQEGNQYLKDEDFINPITGDVYDYKVIDEDRYELCTTFQSVKENEAAQGDYYMPRFDKEWYHGIGYQCLSRKVINYKMPLEPQIIR